MIKHIHIYIYRERERETSLNQQVFILTSNVSNRVLYSNYIALAIVTFAMCDVTEQWTPTVKVLQAPYLLARVPLARVPAQPGSRAGPRPGTQEYICRYIYVNEYSYIYIYRNIYRESYICILCTCVYIYIYT